MGFLQLAIALICSRLVYAESNTTSVSTSNDRVGWVPSDEGRSTSDILWSCFSVLLLCSWKAVHLNIPSRAESQATWYKLGPVPFWPQKLLWRRWGRKIGYMVLVILAPEIGVGLAMKQSEDAKELIKAINDNGGDWTMVHGFYANMGGFALHVSGDATRRERRYPLDAAALIHLHTEAPDIFPKDTEDSIKDRSKADGFTKIFALLQCTWLLVQSIVRGCAGLSISELELATLAFTPCALALYIIWFDKGFDVEHVTTIDISVEEFDKMVAGSMFLSDREELSHGDVRNLRVRNMSFDMFFDSIILGDLDGFRPGIVQIVVYSTGLLFSAVHIVAWNWDFPSTEVTIMWRCFSIIATFTTLTPVFGTLLVVSIQYLQKHLKLSWIDTLETAVMVLGGLVALTYPIARIGLVVLILYCFHSMPAAVYQTASVSWVGYVPHFS